jgi:hypothetical protein
VVSSTEFAALLAEVRASLALFETRVGQIVAENKALIVSSRQMVAASRFALSLAIPNRPDHGTVTGPDTLPVPIIHRTIHRFVDPD